MPYQQISFPTNPNRPFFYTSFATTVDGKIYVNEVDKKGYWPIASKVDYEEFTKLRAYADTIIDGKNTAIRFGKQTIDTIHKDSFKKLRESFGKIKPMEYIILTKNPDDALRVALQNSYQLKPVIYKDDIRSLITYLQEKKAKHVFIDGGPHVIASFLRKKLLDEIFVTIAPRIFGNEKNLAITMVEGLLLEPNEVILKLVSVEKVEDEVFLRYKLLY